MIPGVIGRRCVWSGTPKSKLRRVGGSSAKFHKPTKSADHVQDFTNQTRPRQRRGLVIGSRLRADYCVTVGPPSSTQFGSSGEGSQGRPLKML